MKQSTYLYSSIVIILLVLLARTSKVLAGYQPPPDQQPPQTNSDGLVSRNGRCQSNQPPFLTALAPHKSHVGQTMDTSPTFSWFVPDSQVYNLKFQLYRYNQKGQREPIWSKQLKSKPGIMTLSLPQDTSLLQVGKRYHWKVILLCNPNRPSSALVVGTDIDVVEKSPSLELLVAKAETLAEVINIYGEYGLWYEAFSKALANRRLDRELHLNLLEDLAQLENTQFSQKLTKIMQFLRSEAH